MTAVLAETIPGLETPFTLDRPVVVRWPRKTTGVRAKKARLSRREVTTRLAYRRLVENRLSALIKADVELLKSPQRDGHPWMCAGDDETVHLAGESIGGVGMPKKGYTLVVVDKDAFFAWLADEYPTEILWSVQFTEAQFHALRDGESIPGGGDVAATPSVRPAFWEVLLGCAKTGQMCHPGTGEVGDLPGLLVKPTNPSPTFVKASGVDHTLLARAAHRGDLSAVDVAFLLDLPTPTVQTGGTP
ncbi:hypothetical protein ABT352_33285 [Streptosporangium sp. NPDC000563]|uniref:hypothetical protein n=1 Tax=Streptosporangium sp. NPDC000563 TaxID=3154366 RepID=UPI003318715B